MLRNFSLLHSKFYFYFNRLFSKFNKRSISFHYSTAPIDTSRLTQQFNACILHVGLRAINAQTSREAFDKVIQSLSVFPTLCVPAFTPSFRSSGLFSVNYSRPEVGSLSQQAWNMHFTRTDDPIHSLFIVKGQLVFCDSLSDTFNPEGIYKNFTQPGSCIVNIGTPYLVNTVLHYLERLLELPYVSSQAHHGTVFNGDNIPHPVSQLSYKYIYPVSWNRAKIEQFLLRNGCITIGHLLGTQCRIIDGCKSAKVLISKLRDDPYFLITF